MGVHALHYMSRVEISNPEQVFSDELGSNPIDVTDSSWELYLLIQKTSDQQGNFQDRLLGFAAVYRFYRYPDGSRLRLGQVCFRLG